MLDVKRVILPFLGEKKRDAKKKKGKKRNNEKEKDKKKYAEHSISELVSLQLPLLIASQWHILYVVQAGYVLGNFDIVLSLVYSYQGIIKIRRLQVQLDTLGELGKM